MLFQKRCNGFADFGVFGDFEERFYGRVYMLAIPVIVAINDDVPEGSECLHESLGGAFVKKRGFWAFIGDVLPKIEELLALVSGVIHVGIEN